MKTNLYIYLAITFMVLFLLFVISSNQTAHVIKTGEDEKTNENPIQKISPFLIGFLAVGVVALLTRVVNR